MSGVSRTRKPLSEKKYALELCDAAAAESLLCQFRSLRVKLAKHTF